MHASSLPSSAPPPARGDRALVLGGGGSTGNAWLIGVIAGLHDSGLHAADADLIIGTSAGATTAVQITGASPSDLHRAVLDEEPATRRDPATRPDPASRPDPATRPAASHPAADRLALLRETIAASADIAELRRRMGAMALEREAAASGLDPATASFQARWRDIVAARLPRPEWPERAVLLTAVNARTGEPVAFHRGSGVELVDAVAASCAGGGLAHPIGEGRYIDGGYRANAENADLAAGFARVLVLSPLGGRSLHPREWRTALGAQVDELRAGGSRVETVIPDPGSEHLFGANAMRPSLRPAAAGVGYAQGRALAESLAGFWE